MRRVKLRSVKFQTTSRVIQWAVREADRIGLTWESYRDAKKAAIEREVSYFVLLFLLFCLFLLLFADFFLSTICYSLLSSGILVSSGSYLSVQIPFCDLVLTLISLVSLTILKRIVNLHYKVRGTLLGNAIFFCVDFTNPVDGFIYFVHWHGRTSFYLIVYWKAFKNIILCDYFLLNLNGIFSSCRIR